MEISKLSENRSFKEHLFGVSKDKLTLINNGPVLSFEIGDGRFVFLDKKNSTFGNIKTLKTLAQVARDNIADGFEIPTQQHIDFADKAMTYIRESYYSKNIISRIFLRVFALVGLKNIFDKMKKVSETLLKADMFNREVQDKSPLLEHLKKPVHIPTANTSSNIANKRVFDEKAFKIDLDAPGDVTTDGEEDEGAKIIEESKMRRLRREALYLNPISSASKRKNIIHLN